MSEEEILEQRPEPCGCGNHEHEHTHGHHHEHEHGEHCGCHEHHHHHHEHDGTGGCDDHHHDHHHHHEHGDDCGCGHDHEHEHKQLHEQKVPGVVYTQVKLHDDAKVVSGSLELTGDYDAIRLGLGEGLKQFAAAVNEMGGVIGHIKASAEKVRTEMCSVTDQDVMIKTAPEERVSIILAAIVFFIPEEKAEELGRRALESAIPR